MTKKRINRKSPSDFFRQDPNREHFLYKVEGNSREPIKEIKNKSYDPTQSIWPDYRRLSKLYSRDGKPYTEIHNHPIGSEELVASTKKYNMPSFEDLKVFLRADEVRTAAIYQHNPKTNETEGIYVVRKTKRTPKSGIIFCEIAKNAKDEYEADARFAKKYPELFDSFELGKTVKTLDQYFHLTNNPQHSGIPESDRPRERQKLLDEIIDKLHLRIKYIPAKGYYYSQGKGFIKKKESLEEHLLAILTIACLGAGTFFLSSNITGNVIGSQTISNWIGAVLLVIGLVAGFFWFKSRKNKPISKKGK